MRRAVCPRPQALAGVGHPAAPLSLVGSALWEAPAPPSPAKCPWARCADLLQTGAFGGPFPLWGSRRLCPCPRVWRSVVLNVWPLKPQHQRHPEGGSSAESQVPASTS